MAWYEVTFRYTPKQDLQERSYTDCYRAKDAGDATGQCCREYGNPVIYAVHKLVPEMDAPALAVLLAQSRRAFEATGVTVLKVRSDLDDERAGTWPIGDLTKETNRILATKQALPCGHTAYVVTLREPAVCIQRLPAPGQLVLVISGYCVTCSRRVVIEEVL